MSFISKLMPYVSYLWVVIIGLAVWAYFYIKKQQKAGTLISKRQWIETLPNIISTLGVLGTFFGISVGLLCFDPENLETSIPQLLEGLKTAFFTSLAGMVGSMFLTRKVNVLYDELTNGVSDINQAAGLICKAVENLQTASAQQANSQTVFYNLMQTVVQKMNTNIENMNNNMNSLNIAANNLSLTMTGIQGKIDEIEGSTDSMLASIGNIEEISRNGQKTEEEIDARLGEVMDITSAIETTENQVAERIEKLKEALHGEVIEIEDKMADTNELLEKKFDEFSELLKKNNTEALVEVMKRVTEEFQKQMNDLISRLVKENFEQLNKSVEKLNTWQMENKEMIQSLTKQYRQMAENFESTSTSLSQVQKDTKLLVSEGGKLEQLIDSLNEVIINDEKFKEISGNLQETANLTKSNMESFDASTRSLNEWVRKQRNFNDAVAVLIQKLEELNEMRNYASQFWSDTKKGMNDAVGIISEGSVTLNRQLTGLDQQFYARLSTTLAQLDACIQSLVKNSIIRR